jgi:DnaJ-class molecular chaperone
MRYKSHGPGCRCMECQMTGCGAFASGKTPDICIDCDGAGSYPTGARCKSCDGSGKVPAGNGIPVAQIQ